MSKFLALVALAVFLAACARAPSDAEPSTLPAATPAEVDAVAGVVQAFGSRLVNVALLAPDAPQQIEAQYAEFVTPDLLAAWMADLAQAPGRVTSSPWPDRIEIFAITEQSADVYLVSGQVVEITNAEIDSNDMAAAYPVALTLMRIDGQWLISDYQLSEVQ